MNRFPTLRRRNNAKAKAAAAAAAPPPPPLAAEPLTAEALPAKSQLAACCNWLYKLIGYVVTSIIVFIVLYSLIYINKVFYPLCGTFDGRTCNHRGDCTPRGVCDCYAGYSGAACTETQGPG